MLGSLNIDEDTFLPSENDKLKAQIKDLRRRLANATARDRQLRRELVEENLSFVTVSHLTSLIQDPTRVNEYEMDGYQKEIFNKLMATAEKCLIREMISYHRLSGRSIFQFIGNRSCIRLETFYNKSYKESYYILYSKRQTESGQPIIPYANPLLIEHHTIPHFIHLDTLQKQFLPHNFDTFIRIVHAQVQAYVSKREIVYEIDQLGKSNNAAVRVQFQNESLSNLKIKVKLKEHQDTIIVDMTFKDKSSIFPTDIAIRRWEKNMSAIDFELEDQSNDSFLDEDEMFLYSKIKYDLTVRAMKDVFLELI